MLLRETALVLTQGNGGGSYITCVEFAFLVVAAVTLGATGERIFP